MYSINHINKVPFYNIIKNCAEECEKLKEKYSSLFSNIEIKEIHPDFELPSMYDISMDEQIIVPIAKCASIGSSGIATCFAVTVKGITPSGEKYIGLAHINLTAPETILDSLTSGLKQYGCDERSIEFYVLGGMLPYKGKREKNDSISFENLKEFLDLSSTYNIKGIRFNLINGETGGLTVLMTADGPLWTTRV